MTRPTPNAETFKKQVLQQLPPAIASRTKVELHGRAGIPEILRSARDQELDLVVVGRRLPSEQIGIGSAFSRLARKCPCNVLVVPNLVRLHLGRMLVPVDFSKHSGMALEQATEIARTAGEDHPQIIVHSVCSVGYGYRKMGVNLQEASEQLVATMGKQLTEFVAKVDKTGVEFETICTSAEQIEAAILDMAAVRKVDMIVLGSRGKTWTATALLGSIAERVLVTSPLPVLLVKEKGETTPLLNVLLRGG